MENLKNPMLAIKTSLEAIFEKNDSNNTSYLPSIDEIISTDNSSDIEKIIQGIDTSASIPHRTFSFFNKPGNSMYSISDTNNIKEGGYPFHNNR